MNNEVNNIQDVNNALNINNESVVQKSTALQESSVQNNIEPPKKKGKGKTVLIIILILLVLGLGGFIVYDKVLNKPGDNNNLETDCTKCNVSDNKDENKTSDNNSTSVKKSDVPIEDTYALSVNSSQTGYIDFYLLNDGVLYYKTVKEEEACKNENGYEYCSYQTSNLNPEYEKNDRTLTRFDGIKNIKRIKGTNTVSSGVDFNVILITEEGKVYEYYAGSSRVSLEKMVQNYEVDDILEYNRPSGCIAIPESTTCGGSFKIITKDGKTITGEMDVYGKITEK